MTSELSTIQVNNLRARPGKMRILLPFCIAVWAFSAVMSMPCFYIIPNDNSTCHAENSSFCYTIQQFAMRISNDFVNMENLTLFVTPGRHFLVGGIELNNTTNIIIRGILDSENQAEISCVEKSCFSFRKSLNLHIENLVFTDCLSMNEDSDGGAIFVSEAETLNITRCSFINNVVRRIGGALTLHSIKEVQLLQIKFINNSAICGDISCSEVCTASSGALFSSNISSFLVSKSLFTGNSASCLAGCVSVHYSRVIVENSYFIENSVLADPGAGGGLAITSSMAQISGCLFQGNNVPKGFGSFAGGISTLSSIVVVQNSFFFS